MALGINEILLILVVVGLVALFGRKTILKLAKDFFGIKKDIDKIKKEEEAK